MSNWTNHPLFDFFSIDQRFLDLNVLECGQEQCSPKKKVPPLAKPMYTMHIVQSGKGFIHFDRSIVELKANEIFTIFPNTLVEYYPDEQDPWVYSWVVFNGMQADTLIQKTGVTAENPVYRCRKNSVISDEFNRLVKSYKRYGRINLECLGRLYVIFEAMIEENRKQENVPMGQKESHIKEALTYMTYNYQFDISITDVAKSLGLNVNYFSTIFQEIMKQSPKQFLTSFRMEKSKELLETGLFKVKQVAAMVGFRDQLYFSREFRKYFGWAPSKIIQKQ